ncbi:MAG: hypothetical protein SAK29_32110 [Scytonema sp. PMC 1069.18]|nr:hypothetical protein [Scytonema sp. PMC 1069.18]MEC4887048.1 hypothetical protein [Scytonema sp. PMC 1070.18]
MSSEIYQPTDVQLEHWAKRDELDKYAFAGIMSEEEQERQVNNLLDKNYYHRHLEKVRANKQKLLKDLEYLEQREQLLLDQINKQEQSLQE